MGDFDDKFHRHDSLYMKQQGNILGFSCTSEEKVSELRENLEWNVSLVLHGQWCSIIQ